MKYYIKHSIRMRIIVVVFLLLLSLTTLYVLTLPQIPAMDNQASPRIKHVVPGILILQAGAITSFADGEATIRLIESTTMPPNCADCMERARAEIVKGNESKIIEFRFGGIAGFHDDTAKAFDYKFVIRELQSGSATIEYTKTSEPTSSGS